MFTYRYFDFDWFVVNLDPKVRVRISIVVNGHFANGANSLVHVFSISTHGRYPIRQRVETHNGSDGSAVHLLSKYDSGALFSRTYVAFLLLLALVSCC